MNERAAALGVELRNSAAGAGSGADVVISAVTASEAEAVAEKAASWLAPGQLFLDVNSAAPSTKQRAASHVSASGAHYVECAVMAPVLKPGLAVPILAGGPEAEAAAALMNGLGMAITPVAREYGRASAMKLCRSIVIKGLEALMVDCAAACEGYGVTDPVFASLAETFPSIDWHALAANMRERVATHGVRRAAEMREAARWSRRWASIRRWLSPWRTRRSAGRGKRARHEADATRLRRGDWSPRPLSCRPRPGAGALAVAGRQVRGALRAGRQHGHHRPGDGPEARGCARRQHHHREPRRGGRLHRRQPGGEGGPRRAHLHDGPYRHARLHALALSEPAL